jgi:hypothetical protein
MLMIFFAMPRLRNPRHNQQKKSPDCEINLVVFNPFEKNIFVCSKIWNEFDSSFSVKLISEIKLGSIWYDPFFVMDGIVCYILIAISVTKSILETYLV